MTIRNFLSILLLAFTSLTAHSQISSGRFEFIYVDNYKSAIDAGLTDRMYDSLQVRINAIKSAKAEVYMFVSDDINFDQTPNSASLQSVFGDIVKHFHPSKPVNEQSDLKAVRESVSSMLEKSHPKEIVLNYYVSNDVLDLALSTSYLVDFFPAEVHMYAPEASIKVNFYYPGSKTKSYTDKLSKVFYFCNKGEFKVKAAFNPVAL